ncbi:MAG TPA: FecR domain-containing protein [Gemmatimonadaceae bacterium]|nr:FecR domain-containing protein [Gemmatimonadaceae bacterium]
MTADFSSGNIDQAGAPDWDAVARFLAGESSPAEAAAVRAWLDANPRDRDLLARLDEVAVPLVTANDVDVEAALARVHERMRTTPTLTVARGRGWSSNRNRFLFVAAAAAAAAVIAGVIIRPGMHTNAGVARTYATTTGQRDSVLLADGSRVTLGPRSTLVVPADFASHRSVQLTGDAFFDVHHDAANRFSVRVNGAVIEDVGTTFSIESDAVDATSVSVVSGSVRLRGGNTAEAAGVVLAAGDRGDIDASGRTRVARQVVGADDVAWTSGKLVFRDAPLSQVAAELQRWYGVTLQADDSMMTRRHVTTTFNGESIDQALRILELTLDARIIRQGDSATIHSARGASGSR